MHDVLPTQLAATATPGIDALFLEVHDDPPNAQSDAATVWPLDQLEPLLTTLLRIRGALREAE